MYHNRLIVLDLESTCWEGDPPEGQIPDIIEIGFCKIEHERDVKYIIHDPVQIKVRPRFSSISDYCTALTGWTDKALRGAPYLASIAPRLVKYGFRNSILGGWGNDPTALWSQCTADGVKLEHLPTPMSIIDLQAMFCFTEGLQKRISLDKALEMYGMKFQGQQHRAVDDAWNTALLITRMLGHKPL